MTDLLAVLPDFPIEDFSNIVPSLEKHKVAVTDILTCDATDIAKRAQVPAREVRRLSDALIRTLHAQLGVDGPLYGVLSAPGNDLVDRWSSISVLDDGLDAALGGGIPAGYLTELTGESGAGKTQLLLTLLLAAQLPPPLGLSRSALYISTEAPLATSRLSQLLRAHPKLSDLPLEEKPSLSRVLALQTPDLESQEHILRYQLPVAIARHNVGLIVIDSITANYRAEFDVASSRHDAVNAKKSRQGPISMARRSAQLAEVGSLLREIARAHNIAIIVANQVSDRFQPDASADSRISSAQASQPSSFPAALETSRSKEALYQTHVPSASEPVAGVNPAGRREWTRGYDPLTLDYQQRFFTGWGACPTPAGMKTPSLGLVWANQIACRIALTKTQTRGRVAKGQERMLWRRHFKVVFAPWAKGEDGTRGTEFVVEQMGIRSVGSQSAVFTVLENQT